MILEAHVVGKLTTAAHDTGPLGLPPELLIELVERPEDHSADVEEDGERGEHKLENGYGMHSLHSRSLSFNRRTTAPRMKQMEYTATHHTRAMWCTAGCRSREGLLMKAKMTPALSAGLARCARSR